MAPTITKWISLIFLSVLLKPQIPIQAQQQVPCVFFFGDSYFDTGNNNGLITKSKSNYRPYGIDYPDGPTGRFSNGRVIPDFLAELLGFANPISPYVTARGSDDILRGVNYASGVAGIRDETLMGGGFSMNRQVKIHRATISSIKILFKKNQTSANDYLNKCLYVVNIGSYDYLNDYYLPESPFSRQFYTPDRFAEILIQGLLNQQLRTLYRSGARKVAVFGVGLLGCLPQELAIYPTNGLSCVDFINNGVKPFNNRLTQLIDSLNRDLPGAQFTFINITKISGTNPSLIGLRFTNASCCPVQSDTGLCVPNQVPCSNRNEYTFWDNLHPTDIINRATASRSYTALFPTDAYPVDIRRLVHQ
ncbi:GDSL esterase/lipase at1g29670 [Phtheirospermum japonicum]|uniref:GDSL esterase/lipase at1g29670 n=1 Tax=Phtheirospermum japonicum TaxID=374723 RepID=A0A830D3Y1_9LAMI|nr:GDSL esterase/lipase at1g29670 [Phtheirospermum japonicum]